MSVDFTKVTDIEFEGIDMADYPKFCDAYIDSAVIDGVEATKQQLDEINENYEFVYEKLHRCIVILTRG